MEKAGIKLGEKFEVTLETTTDTSRLLSEVRKFINEKVVYHKGIYIYEEDAEELFSTVSASKARPAVAWSSVLYRKYDINMTPEEKAALGTIIDKFKVVPTKYVYDFWHCLDWEAGEFADNHSCYWTERYNSRQIMMNDPHFIAIRFYLTESNEYGYREGAGLARAIIHENEDFYSLFNVYSLGGKNHISYLTAARVLSQHLHGNHIFHHTAKLTNCKDTDGMLWINAAGYLVPKDKTKFKSLPDEYDLNRKDIASANYGGPISCYHCGDGCDNDWEFEGHYYCEDCYYEVSHFECEFCGDLFHLSEMSTWQGHQLCEACYEDLPRCNFALRSLMMPPMKQMSIVGGMMVPVQVYNANHFTEHICEDLVEGTDCCHEHFNRFGTTCPNCHTSYMQIDIKTEVREVNEMNFRTGNLKKVKQTVTLFVHNPYMPCPECGKEKISEHSESRYSYA